MCKDCNIVCASKFFPIESPDGTALPLCERDYFRRLNLLCGKCDQALRGSYITAINKKYHVEHFTCSICPTLFGPQDSYYEHIDNVYCHFHYCTRFATKCVGCNSAILKQFVEVNRNGRDECWHPECYMIHKFWNFKLEPKPEPSEGEESTEPPYAEEERSETPATLKTKQTQLEQKVYRIWTVLSAFEESSAACISDMLRNVSNGHYLPSLRFAQKFILHVEVLFAVLDDMDLTFSRFGDKRMSHVREARLLCRKTVDLFTLLSQPQRSERQGMTQELLALVTGLAHYLKILIRIGLTAAVRLEGTGRRNQPSIPHFLDKLHVLAVQGADPTAKRLATSSSQITPYDFLIATKDAYCGYSSLTPELFGTSTLYPSKPGEANLALGRVPSDLCIKCRLTVEEDCVRLDPYQRWHSTCVECVTCHKTAFVPAPKDEDKEEEDQAKSTRRRPLADVAQFVFPMSSTRDVSMHGDVPTAIYCIEHAQGPCEGGFKTVTRLEQYAFLLNVALRRLYHLLKVRGVVLPGDENALEDTPAQAPQSGPDFYMHKLDRKLSASSLQPKRSTIIESPSDF